MFKIRGTGTSEIPAIDLTTPLAVVDGGTGVSVTRQLAQIVTYQTGAYASGSTILPSDDTVPQITEGDEYLSLAITPVNAGSTLEIDVELNAGVNTVTNSFIVALFQLGTANAIASCMNYYPVGAAATHNMKIKHFMVSGTTSIITFKVRAGQGSAGTTYFNGSGGARLLGGTLTSRITIKEYLP